MTGVRDSAVALFDEDAGTPTRAEHERSLLLARIDATRINASYDDTMLSDSVWETQVLSFRPP